MTDKSRSFLLFVLILSAIICGCKQDENGPLSLLPDTITPSKECYTIRVWFVQSLTVYAFITHFPDDAELPTAPIQFSVSDLAGMKLEDDDIMDVHIHSFQRNEFMRTPWDELHNDENVSYTYYATKVSPCE